MGAIETCLDLTSRYLHLADRFQGMTIDGHADQGSVQLRLAVQGTHVAIRADEAGGIKDPAVDQHLEFGELARFEALTAPQGMEIAIRVEAKLGWAVITMGQLLTGITKRLEVSDRLWMLQGCHDL